MASQALRRLGVPAKPVVADLLDAALGSVQPPIRSELFGPQRFAQHGRSLAKNHLAVRRSEALSTFFPRMRDNIQTLRRAHDYIGHQARNGYDISPAAEWLLDNFHLIEVQLKSVREGLPRSFYRALPTLAEEPLAGLPRVYGVAWAFVAHTDGAFDEGLLEHFLTAYQSVSPLNLNELWALPTTLRVVLIENLRRLAERVATAKAAREVANLCCDQIGNFAVSTLKEVHRLLETRGVGHLYLLQMSQRLLDGHTIVEEPIGQWLRAMQPDLAVARVQQTAEEAADNLSVSNAVTTLRALGDFDWTELVERCSALMRLMLLSPAFKAEETATRDRTLHAIEGLARRSHRAETDVARILLEQMAAQGDADAATGVASHWLHGRGRPALLAALGLHAGLSATGQALVRRSKLPAYLGMLLLSTWALVRWMLPNQSAMGLQPMQHGLYVLGAVLMVFPASEAVVALVNRLISESVRPSHLPRLALSEGIPPEHAVLVAVPGMLTSVNSVRALTHQLLLHSLANPERHVQFALLSDWADADTQRHPQDQLLLDTAVRQIEALNAQVQAKPAAPPRFVLLHRERRFCETEQRWLGWERKRGKLEQLVRALAQGSSSDFLDLGAVSRLAPDIRYVVTLDADTQLPPGRLRELVGVAAHPHNQPRLNAAGNAVVGGYAILQPRVATSLPPNTEFTLYHWLFAGKCGIDTYSAAASEFYQDVFGEGSFTGKGLLHVQAVHAVLGGRLPEGQVLSHDMLEGALARCAVVTDVPVIEDAPLHADMAASRVHRWCRGDWQLLPFLLRPWRYPLHAINRWKMLDNLRRSLVAPLSLAFLLLALSGNGVSAWSALLLVLAAFTAGPLLGAVAGLLSVREDLAKAHFYRHGVTELTRAVWGGLWLLAQLLAHSMAAMDAIGRTLYRLLFSRRHLLQWTTSAQAQAQVKYGLGELTMQHVNTPLVALVILVLLLVWGTPYPLLSVLLCITWSASPLWIWLVSTVRPTHFKATLSPTDRAYLLDLARDTWRLFEYCVGPQDNHLPPDNLQTEPAEAVAHRTSPTNIGLYMLSAVCAHQFGWTGLQDLLTRLEATQDTLQRLQRYKGHFFNWYDTQTCAPLLPAYVSTVDSGNLCAHLLSVAQACRALAQSPATRVLPGEALQRARERCTALLATAARNSAQERESLRSCLADYRNTRRSLLRDEQADTATKLGAQRRLEALAQRLEDLAWSADFAFLYDRKRRLFHIGYRVAEQKLDASFYDLLASESRLTSLLAIAKGDVPACHWTRLGRPTLPSGFSRHCARGRVRCLNT